MTHIHIEWWFTTIGLVLLLIGSILLFLGTPRDYADYLYKEPDPIYSYKHLQEHPDHIQDETDKLVKRQKRSINGFGLVAIGFILQLASQILDIL